VGLIYSSADSQQLIKALKSNINNAKETLNQLKSGSQKVVSAVDGKTLAGAAYTAGKGLFSELIIPTISKVTQAFDQLTQELQTFEAANNVIQVKGSYLNEDLIMQTIQIKKAQKQAALTSVSTLLNQITISDSPDMDAYIRSTQRKMNVLADNLSSEIRVLEKKIESLQTFSSSTNSLFSQSLNNLNIAIQSMNVLNDTMVLDHGAYILPQGTDKSWFTEKKDSDMIEENTFKKAKGKKTKQWIPSLNRFMYVENPNSITPEELRFNETYKKRLFTKDETETGQDLLTMIAIGIRDGIDPFTGRKLTGVAKAGLMFFAISQVFPSGKYSGKFKAKMPTGAKLKSGKVVNPTTGKILKNNNKIPAKSTIKNQPTTPKKASGANLNKLKPNEINNMSLDELRNSIPKDWQFFENNGRVHIKDANGNFRVRIDPPDKVTNYEHMHIFDENKNPLDIKGNIVDKKSPDGHIPWTNK